MQLGQLLPFAQMGQEQLDFLFQIAQVLQGACVIAGDDFVARAVVAQRFAKRNMHIQRKRYRMGSCAVLALRQGLDILRLTMGIDETICGRIRGVSGTGHIKTLQKFR